MSNATIETYMGLREYLNTPLRTMTSVGSPVGIDPPLRRMVAIAQKNIANDMTTRIGPMSTTDCSGANLKGTIARKTKPSRRKPASRMGGWNATPA